MIKIVKAASFALILSALFVVGARAQGSYTAASCNYSDVNAVINGPTHTAVSGDTINIPSGSCIWTSQLSISVGITLIGNGTPNTLPSQFGVGTLNTTITDDYTNTNAPMIGAMVPNGQTLRISSLVIQPNSSSTQLYSPIGLVGTCNSSGCPNLRADNLEFTGWTEGGNGNQAAWMIRTDGVYGVMDHNTIPAYANSSSVLLANAHHAAWLGVGANGDNSWASSDTFGTNAALYFENNSLTTGTLDCDEGPAQGGQGGCRVVVRFNQYPWGTANSSILFTHGTESTGRTRGTRQVEVYGNTATCDNTSQGCSTGIVGMRSGVAMIFDNSLTAQSGSWFTNMIATNDYRTYAQFTPWGTCNGQGPWDSNTGTTYYTGTYTGTTGSQSFVDASETWAAAFGSSSWAATAAAAGAPYSVIDTTQGFGAEISSSSGNNLNFTNNPVCNWGSQSACTWTNGDRYIIMKATLCIDQPGRGGNGATYLSGSTPSPTGLVNEPLDPLYEWADSVTGSLNQGVLVSSTAHLIANRDWYVESKNQAAQTSPTSPFDGTSGNGHGALANRPSTCTVGVGYFATDQGSWNSSGNSFGQGALFVCTATNTWSLYYTPYSYPHPLAVGTTNLSPPTNVTAVGH